CSTSSCGSAAAPARTGPRRTGPPPTAPPPTAPRRTARSESRRPGARRPVHGRRRDDDGRRCGANYADDGAASSADDGEPRGHERSVPAGGRVDDAEPERVLPEGEAGHLPHERGVAQRVRVAG